MPEGNDISVDETAIVHPSAILEGKVTVGEECSIGPRCVLAGRVTLGRGCFIGAGSVLSGDLSVGDHTAIHLNVAIRGKNTIGSYVCIYDLVNIEGGRPFDESGDRSIVGDRAWINHGATMHGCEIGEGAAVCINAALDYHCKIGPGAIVTNGSACRVGTVVPDNCVAEGVPAEIVRRDITDEDRVEILGLLPSDWVVRTARWVEQLVRDRRKPV